MTEKSPRRQAGILFILLTLFIDILGIGIIIPILPDLIKEFVRSDPSLVGEGGSLIGWLATLVGGESAAASAVEGDKVTSVAGFYYGAITASYALMQFIFAPVMGALSDRYGRRPILLAALFGLGIDYLIQGFAPTIYWLFAGRVLAGIMGASFPAANAYIADVSNEDTRARNYGLMGVMFGLGFICGPVLGGVLGEIDLRLPFFVSAGLALLNWLYGFFILPESHPPEKRSAFDLSKANPLGTLARLRKYPLVAGLAVAFFCMSLAQRGLENVWVLFTTYQFGWSKLTNGLMLGLVGVSAALVQGGMVRPMVRRFGERKTLIIGLSVACFSFLGYGLAYQPWMIPALILFGSFAGVSGPAVQSLVAGVVPGSEQGKIQGALTSLASLTSIIAPVLFTAGLFSYFTSDQAPFILPGAPFLVGSALWAIALIVAVRVFRRIPDTPRDEKLEEEKLDPQESDDSADQPGDDVEPAPES